VHAQRAFADALKGMKKPGRAARALDYSKARYQVETLTKSDPPQGETRVDRTYRLRQQHSVPLLHALLTWLDEQAAQVLPESLLGRAISYTCNQWEYLGRYVNDGRAPVDNNVIERLWIRIPSRSYPRDGIMQGSSLVQSVSHAAPALLQCTVGYSC
jgi:transposase